MSNGISETTVEINGEDIQVEYGWDKDVLIPENKPVTEIWIISDHKQSDEEIIKKIEECGECQKKRMR